MGVRDIYVYVAAIAGTFGLAVYFIDVPLITSGVSTFISWITIMSTMMLGMGAYNNLRFNIGRIQKRRTDWQFNVVLVGCFVFMFLLGIYVWFNITRPEWYFWYNSIIPPSNAALWAIVFFYIVSSAFRAMRPRNLDAVILLIGAVMVMFYNAPIAEAIHPALPKLGGWVFNLATTTGMRALLIGIALGVTSMGLRILMGKERRSLGGFEA